MVVEDIFGLNRACPAKQIRLKSFESSALSTSNLFENEQVFKFTCYTCEWFHLRDHDVTTHVKKQLARRNFVVTTVQHKILKFYLKNSAAEIVMWYSMQVCKWHVHVKAFKL